jgi:hypothetical protein
MRTTNLFRLALAGKVTAGVHLRLPPLGSLRIGENRNGGTWQRTQTMSQMSSCEHATSLDRMTIAAPGVSESHETSEV